MKIVDVTIVHEAKVVVNLPVEEFKNTLMHKLSMYRIEFTRFCGEHIYWEETKSGDKVSDVFADYLELCYQKFIKKERKQ